MHAFAAGGFGLARLTGRGCGRQRDAGSKNLGRRGEHGAVLTSDCEICLSIRGKGGRF